MTRRGFSLVELLVVVTIMGLLATLGLPRLAATRQRAVAASMVSDLRNLVAAQEAFFSSYQDYAAGVAAAEVAGPGGKGRVRLVPSSGNIISITRRAPNNANGAGWSATARNPAVTAKAFDVCGVYIGSTKYAPNKAVMVEGGVACY